MRRVISRTGLLALFSIFFFGCTPDGEDDADGGGSLDSGPQPDAVTDAPDDGAPDPDTGAPGSDTGVPQPDDGVARDMGEPEPDPDMGEPEPDPDMGEPEPDPDMGEPEPDPDMGEPEPDPDMGEPEPDPDMGEPEPDMGCLPTPEVCNGVDDDCDGAVDDVDGLGDPCAAGQGACAAAGTLVCGEAGPVCSAVPAEPGVEVCNGVDDDCDGAVDDVDGLGDPCVAGQGACAAAGTIVCGEAGPVCSAVPAEPSVEVCNGVDDDCNGVVDDPPACVVEICAAAGDEDGNGVEDCADPACAGTARCRPGLSGVVLLCGSSERDISVIFGPADDVVLQAGCAPDAETLAMALTRSGDFDPDVVEPWVRAGGRLVTEYDATDAAYDALFDINPFLGGEEGSCRDNINPVVRFNEDDPFWRDNGDLPSTPLAESGCGFDMAAYPFRVDLGGWDEISLSLAYRGLGRGRLWMVESDWQDADPGEVAFSPATQQLLRYMLIGDYAPARTTVLRCGRLDRDIDDFIPLRSGLELADGCVPDASTQALLISRFGANRLDGPGLRAYLEAGGVVITEYNTVDEVYNAVFPAAQVEQGAFNGDCSDQVNPPVRFNEGDPFWQANGDLPLGDPDLTGCGPDVSAYPGVVPLGGWDAETVSLGYLDVGAGRLWLVPVDWQDGNGGFGAPSLQLMQYMIAERGPERPIEHCDIVGDEDGDGLADCADPACVDRPDCAPPEDG